MRNQTENRDVVIVGAGLSGGLLALCLRAKRPDLNLLLIDRAPTGSLNKTWSCHLSDLEGHDWLDEKLFRTWPGYEVRFPCRKRRLHSPYGTLTPQRLEQELRARLSGQVQFDADVESCTSTEAILKDGRKLRAKVVIDSRGLLTLDATKAGFQKFVGSVIRFKSPHGLREPVLMDARVAQLDGFRFFYVLPMSERELLIEDTRFSSSPDLDVVNYASEILTYAETHYGAIDQVVNQESGVLPLPFDFAKPQDTRVDPQTDTRLNIGMAAGFFHVVTGYSLPMALDVAEAVASLPQLSVASVRACLDQQLVHVNKERRYFHLLNKMTFQAADPTQRYRIFERFYGFAPDLIARFYLGRLTLTDKARILLGRPPVSIRKSIRALLFAKADA